MRFLHTCSVLCASIALLAGCDSAPPVNIESTTNFAQTAPRQSDPEKVRKADYSILFVGNSHTTDHNLPALVCKMVHTRFPAKTVYCYFLGVGFLEHAAGDPRFKEEIEARSWKYVILQAQKISASGKYNYSQQEGIDLAKSAKERGAKVLFYSEWGLEGVVGDGARNEKIYQEMADQAGVEVARIGRAWDIALAGRPDLPLYAEDGNHQSALGAFLTACVLFGGITGESPTVLGSFPYAEANETDRKFLADAAAKALGNGKEVVEEK